MKRISDNGKIIYISNNFNEINEFVKDNLKYPFEKDMLNLLKNENEFLQKYFFIKENKKYAFFTMYENKMNIFTFGKLKLFLKVKVIGFPCSLSNCGYITNDEKMMFDYIKTIKGAILVLNNDEKIPMSEMTIGETLPTCILNKHLKTIDEYMESMRSPYRYRINKAKVACRDIVVKTISDDSINIYELYLNTYKKSDYKLEKLKKGFFDKVNATKLVFLKNNIPIGFVLLKKNSEKLIFMLCGMDYKFDTTDLYYYMLYNIVCFAIENKCNEIDFGQTSEETKMKFGAILQKKYFYAHHSNKLLNIVLKVGKGLLEYKYNFPNYHVFKEGIR